MARERYLVGVEQSDLSPSPPPESPKTLKDKVKNLWYHYKWVLLTSFFVVIVLVFIVMEFVKQEKYDYHILYATTQGQSANHLKVFEEELEKYGKDIDGNGEVSVLVDYIFLGEDNLRLSSKDLERLTTLMATHETPLVIVDTDIYKHLYNSRRERDDEGQVIEDSPGYPIFMDIPYDKEDERYKDVDDEQRYWNWKNHSMREDEVLRLFKANLFFGVRLDPEGKDDGSGSQGDTKYFQAMELLHSIIKGSGQTNVATTVPEGSSAETSTDSN